MAAIPVFYSFHFANDAMRVNLVRNIGAIEDNKPVSAPEWESIRKSAAGIIRWIDENMSHRRCVIVLAGSETANRPWVQYEIAKAWNDHRAIFGIYIHNLRCARTRMTCSQGGNPLAKVALENGNGRLLSDLIPCYEPGPDAYNSIASRMEGWVNGALVQAKARWG